MLYHVYILYVERGRDGHRGGIITILEQDLERMTEFPIDFRNRTLYAEKQLKLM